jgi:serine/threonine-protein kinase
VDKRSDIWSFGVVLYEMLARRRPFEGESISDTLAAVLSKEPDWQSVPAKAQRMLKSCLEKEPKHRLRDIADAWRLLDKARVAPVVKSSARWRVAAGVLAVVSAISAWGWWRTTKFVEGMSQPAVRADLELGPDVSFGSTIGPAVILSPDGTRLVFVSRGKDGTPRLFTRRLDQAKAAGLPATEGAYAPFFSPDAQWVGFFAQGKLKKTRIDGGQPVSLCDAPAGRGASWGQDNNIIAALDVQTTLAQVRSEGGRPISITELGPGELSHRWPHVLPGSKAVLFTVNREYAYHEHASIALVSLNDHRSRILLDHAGMYPRYLPSGHLVYTTKGVLFAVPFDLGRLEVGDKVTPLQEVGSDPTVGSAQIDFSRSGTLVYRTFGTPGLRTIQWLDGAGKAEPLGYEPAAYLNPRLSPDGNRLALMLTRESSTDLWLRHKNEDRSHSNGQEIVESGLAKSALLCQVLLEPLIAQKNKLS